MAKTRTPWRAASAIICAANRSLPTLSSVFMVQRGAAVSFMPSSWAFPGGNLEDADYDAQWAEITSWKARQPRTLAVLPIYSEQRKLHKRTLPELALRICALRELYEECGVLAVNDVDSHQLSCFNINSSEQTITPQECNSLELAMSSCPPELIRDSPDKFIDIFLNQSQFVPAVDKLYEWSNWLTPISPLHGGKRFDTVFYTLHVNETFDSGICIKELADAQWLEPLASLRAAYNNQLKLAPPQIYQLAELYTLTTENQRDDLSLIAQKRIQSGHIHRICPQFWLCDNGVRVSVMPGDSAFVTDDSTQVEPQVYDGTAVAFRNEAELLHRVEFTGKKGWSPWHVYCSPQLKEKYGIYVQDIDVAKL